MDLKEGMIVMKEGRLMTVQNGELKLMEEEVIMEDGTRIQIDGSMVMADGTTRKVEEGEILYPGGTTPDTTEMPEMASPEEMTGTETHDST